MEGRLNHAAALILAAALATPTVAGAAGNCASRAEIVGALAAKYGESRRAAGLETAANLVEVWASDATGSWTILVTRPDGIACIAASGGDWLEYEAKVPVAEQPS